MTKWILTSAALAALIGTSAAFAGVEVQVTIIGEVEFSHVDAPPLGLMTAGDSVEISFTLDSDNFVDGVFFPTRGYAIDQESFSLTAGAASLGLQDPYVDVPYFILRDDNSAVDGFLFGTDPDAGIPNGLALDQPGFFGTFQSLYATTDGGDTLPSLDIVDAVGTYELDNMALVSMGILDGDFNAAGFIFSEMTISLVPAPATLVLLAPFGLVTRRRRR